MNEEQQIGYDSQDSVGKFTHICHFKRADGNKREKVKKKHAFIFIPRDVFIELLWHPIFMKVTVPFLFYRKLT